MKICCLIDSLVSGGAQRQMTWLVRLLVEAGHDVRLVAYHRQYQHFLPDVVAVGVQPEYIDSRSKAGRLWKVRRSIRQMRPDCIISYLNTPNYLAIFSSIGFPRVPVIVSERALDIRGKTVANLLRFNAFRFSDRIVANSFAQTEFICSHFPFLATKVRTIVNCVDLQRFSPAGEKKDSKTRKIIVGASVNSYKNTLRFVESVAIAIQRLPPGSLKVDWFGNNFFRDGKPTAGSKYYLEVIAASERFGLKEVLNFFDPVKDIHLRFQEYDGACLPSIFEGCPNFICEAMACGLPIVASRVSDLQKIVGEQESDGCGRLFNPLFVSEMADSLVSFALSDFETLSTQGKNARQRAIKLFSPELCSIKYNELVKEVVQS